MLGIKYEAAKHIVREYRRTGHHETRRVRKVMEKYECLDSIERELKQKSSSEEDQDDVRRSSDQFRGPPKKKLK